MRISELPGRMSAVKGHLTPEFPTRSSDIDGWVGFTPLEDTPSSRGKLRSTINRQMANGYILEYVTISLPSPNRSGRPLTPEEKALHAKAAGALTAVYKLANVPVPARQLIGSAQYDDLQDRCDQRGARVRWSEAYPIIEAWEITGWPKARNILGQEAAERRCEQQSRLLKELSEDDRAKLAHLDLRAIDLPAGGLAARYFIDRAQQENKNAGIPVDGLAPADRPLYEDYGVMEGTTKETRVRLVQRDRHLVRILKNIGPLTCIICRYDPIERGANDAQARAILEAHHRVPFQVQPEKRLSRVDDLMLLCPNCHREVHQGILSVPDRD